MSKPFNEEELETWLEEVNLASKEINALATGDTTIDDFDKKLKIKQVQKERQESLKRQKEDDLYRKKVQGRFGKGHKQDYRDFCKACFREYELPTPKCLHCQKETQSMELRREYLLGKVKEYQENKTRKGERKVKWDLWKKTQAMVWKKTSTNYSKWDYFTSSSEEEDTKEDPIVPENDPNFKAMEMDLEKRAKDKKARKLKAEDCKKKGNNYMQEGNYEKAVLWYSEGLDLVKDYKALYTNRALAWIKMGYFKKAIKDCSSVLEFCECFEDGYTKSKDFTFKSFLRRGLAHKERKDFEKALDDVKQSLILFPQDAGALQLKEEVEFCIQHQEKANKLLQDKQKLSQKEQKQNKNQKSNDNPEESNPVEEEEENNTKNNDSNSKKKEQQEQNQQQENNETKQQENNKSETISQGAEDSEQKKDCEMENKFNESESIQKCYMDIIDVFMKKEENEIQDIELEILRHVFTNLPAESKVYFYEKKGLQKLIKILRSRNTKCYILIDIFLRDNILYQTQFIKSEGNQLLYEKINNLLKLSEGSNKKNNQNNFDQIEEILEILITLSTTDKIRNILKDNQQTINLVKETFARVLKNFRDEVPMVSNWLKFVGNMCYQESLVKQCIISDMKTYLQQYLYPIVALDKKRSKYELLRENAFNLISNLLVDPKVREIFVSGQYNELLEQLMMRISAYNLVQHPKYINVAQSALSILVNLSFKASPECKILLTQLKVGEVLMNRFSKLEHKDEKFRDLFFRLLQTLSALNYQGVVTGEGTPLLEKKMHLFCLKFFDDYSIKNGLCNHAIRILATIFGTKDNEIWLSKNVENSYYQLIAIQVKKLINSEDELRFCNSCTLAGFLSLFQSEIINPLFYDIIERLILVCSSNTGNMRKSAAHLLGKLARNPENLNLIREKHGIEILHSILKQVA